MPFPRCTASIVALGKMVRDWYHSRRFEALVMLDRSVENYRFGYLPIEIPKQGWKIARDDERAALGHDANWTW